MKFLDSHSFDFTEEFTLLNLGSLTHSLRSKKAPPLPFCDFSFSLSTLAGLQQDYEIWQDP